MNTPEEQKENIFKKFEILSLKYHNLSLLMHELGQSIKCYSTGKSVKQTKEYIKSLNLDIDKLIKLTKAFSDVTIKDTKKEVKQ